MTTLKRVYAAIVNAVRSYPNGAAMLASLAVVLGARFGLNFTANEVTAVASVLAALIAGLTHTTTVPKVLLKDK